MEVQNRESQTKTKRETASKSNWLWMVAAIPLVLLGLVTWGLIEPYTLDTEEESAIIPNLPPAWEGKRVAQLTDFQVGMWWDNVKTISKSVDLILEEQPAAVFITGDFIYHAQPDPEVEINEVVELLRPLTDTNIPVYAVLGNHDYAMNKQSAKPDFQLADRLAQSLEDVGIDVLRNESVTIPLDGQDSDLYVVGVDSHWANSDRVEETLSQLPDNSARIVSIHNPDTFVDFPANTAPFAMAGHTHGGQIRLPLLPHWSWLSFAKDDNVYVDGWVEEDYGKPGNSLYVNRGVGFSDIPIRINCAPEMTFFTLKSQES